MAPSSGASDLFATGKANFESAAGSKVGGGRYRLIRILGSGGMGVVWLAYDERLNCEVALKFLPPQIRHDPSALDELRRETSRSRKLTHPNIVRIHDLYEASGEEDAFISMEYVDGRNLADLRSEQPSYVFSWFLLKPLVAQLCAALEYAHAERIIHRDLKPANLIVDNKRRLKLADFGIARTVSDTMTRTAVGQTSGTLLYMSPQQLDGGIPHPTDDIYSLGAILYDLLTGKPPFYTGDVPNQVRTVEPRPMQKRLEELQITNDIPHGIEQVILACLSKDVSQRPQSATEVGRLLDGSGLRLVDDTQTRLALSTARKQPARKKQQNVWWWALAGGCACGIAMWALASNLKVSARGPEPKPERATRSGVAEPVSVILPSNRAPEPLAAPAKPTAKEQVLPKVIPNEQPVARPVAKEHVVPATPVSPAPVVVEPPTPKPNSVAPSPTSIAKGETVPVTTANESKPPMPTRTTTPETNRNPTVTSAKPTALQLLQKGNSYVSARSQNRVLQIASERTPVDEAPRSWRLSYFDEKASAKTVEVRFEAGEMERVFEPSAFLGLFSFGSSKTLDLDKVGIDSDRAIRIAASQCDPTEVTLKFVEVKLERGYGGLPVWNVKLFGIAPGRSADDASLGFVILLAEDGKVLKKDIVTKSEKPASKK